MRSDWEGRSRAGRPVTLDAVLIFLLLSVAASLLLVQKLASSSGTSQFLVVECGTAQVYNTPWDDKGVYTFSGPLGESRLELTEAGARMVSSPCPDKICIEMGIIDRPGQAVVCIPNRIVIRVSRGRE
ncbi:MAG: NusG domain II-containing protein [Bacillota bacterium]